MSVIQVVYLALVFLAVLVVALVIFLQLSPNALRSRLQNLEPHHDVKESESTWVSRIIELSGPFARLSLPSEGWESSSLRIRFMNAGYPSARAPLLFFAAKTLLTILLPALVLLYAVISGAGEDMSRTSLAFLILFAAAVGYILPNVFLGRRIAHRKRAIFESVPDALDLTTVCVEAGLGLDAALARVGDEMRARSPILGDELHLVNLELRAGGTREQALRNLALRTGVEEIDTLVALLVQSDRFGTSIAEALRVYSDTLRTKRRLRAEEAAAKIPLKLLFPLIFMIFPSLLLVLLGPAFINIYRVLLPTLNG